MNPQSSDSQTPSSATDNITPDIPQPQAPASEAPWAQHEVIPVQRPATTFTPITASPNKPSNNHHIVASLLIVFVAVAAFGIVAALGPKGQEAQVGSAYISALQNKDYSAIEQLTDPEVAKLGDKIGKLGGEEAKTGFYKGLVRSTDAGSIIGSGETKQLKVTKETAGDTKFAYVTYTVGSKQVTALETYDGNQPKVLTVESGLKAYPAAKFNSDYKSHKTQLGTMSKMVDQIAEGAGSSSKETIQSIFTVN